MAGAPGQRLHARRGPPEPGMDHHPRDGHAQRASGPRGRGREAPVPAPARFHRAVRATLEQPRRDRAHAVRGYRVRASHRGPARPPRDRHRAEAFLLADGGDLPSPARRPDAAGHPVRGCPPPPHPKNHHNTLPPPPKPPPHTPPPPNTETSTQGRTV